MTIEFNMFLFNKMFLSLMLLMSLSNLDTMGKNEKKNFNQSQVRKV